MSNLKRLIQKILDDAKIEAGKIKEEADEKSNEIIHEQEVKANKEKEIYLEKAREEVQSLENLILSEAQMNVRDSLLRARQDMLDKTFDLAKDKLAKLGDKEYTDFIKRKLEALDLKGNETLVVAKERFELVKSLGLKLEISETQAVTSGFILLTENVNYNFSFDSLIEFQREDLEAEIAKVLFVANEEE